MSKKSSTNPAPASYLTKVKKDKPSKNSKPNSNDTVLEQRHEKINFKQYLRDLKEQEDSNDEFVDINLLTPNSITLEGVRDSDDLLTEKSVKVDFGGEDGILTLNEQHIEDIKNLDKDDSITIRDEYDEGWYISRSLRNELVFESQEYDLNGKLKYDDFVNKL